MIRPSWCLLLLATTLALQSGAKAESREALADLPVRTEAVLLGASGVELALLTLPDPVSGRSLTAILLSDRDGPWRRSLLYSQRLLENGWALLEPAFDYAGQQAERVPTAQRLAAAVEATLAWAALMASPGVMPMVAARIAASWTVRPSAGAMASPRERGSRRGHHRLFAFHTPEFGLAPTPQSRPAPGWLADRRFGVPNPPRKGSRTRTHFRLKEPRNSAAFSLAGKSGKSPVSEREGPFRANFGGRCASLSASHIRKTAENLHLRAIENRGESVASQFPWRPQRDSNPCYQRERLVS
jgi:hypothetical protein